MCNVSKKLWKNWFGLLRARWTPCISCKQQCVLIIHTYNIHGYGAAAAFRFAEKTPNAHMRIHDHHVPTLQTRCINTFRLCMHYCWPGWSLLTVNCMVHTSILSVMHTIYRYMYIEYIHETHMVQIVCAMYMVMLCTYCISYIQYVHVNIICTHIQYCTLSIQYMCTFDTYM